MTMNAKNARQRAPLAPQQKIKEREPNWRAYERNQERLPCRSPSKELRDPLNLMEKDHRPADHNRDAHAPQRRPRRYREVRTLRAQSRRDRGRVARYNVCPRGGATAQMQPVRRAADQYARPTWHTVRDGWGRSRPGE